jgi:t-SNARE complex subunit (syntaxin)
LKHTDAIIATYKRRQMKHLKHVSEALAKICEKTLENYCKHTHHLDKILATYV